MTRLLISALLMAVAMVAQAQAAQTTPKITITQPWVRATVAQQKSTGAFVTLTAAANSQLVEVRSSVAEMVEIHEMAMDGDTMKMRAVTAVALPAGRQVQLKPGSFHVMLMGLKRPLLAGQTVPLTLVFESPAGRGRQSIEVMAEVRPLGSR